MNTRRSGFTLVELMVAILISTVLITAAYQALIAQNRSYRATDAMVQGQDALRIALGVLESELQEVASIGGSGAGGIGDTDIFMMSADSIRLRAPRKLGFVCSVSPSDLMMTVWSRGELFEDDPPDRLLIFVDGDITTYTDDEWQPAVVANTTSSNETCVTSPTGEAHQKVILASFGLNGVATGAPIRGFEEVSYGLFSFDGEWGLGRRDSDGTKLLVGGLAGPGEGLRLEYRDQSGSVTTDRESVETIEINLQTAPHAGSGVEPVEVTSTIHLRNQ